MKKIFCLFFAFVIVLLCGVNVFAASSKRIIGASIPNATSYELYLLKNGVYTLMQISSSINFDLLSLDLDPGDHQFVVRATAPGFAPSSYSNVVTYSVSAGEAFAVYSETDNSLTFYKNNDTVTAGSTYKGKAATAVYTGIETFDSGAVGAAPWEAYCEDIESVVFVDKISPISTAYWFCEFRVCSEIDVSKLDVSKVTDMTQMFQLFADYVTGNVKITGHENWDTSKVINMYFSFRNIGRDALSVDLGDFSYWNTSNVTSMRYMFAYTAENSSSVKISGLENWDTSKVIDMSRMFRCFGLNSSYYLDLSGWDVSNVDTANNGAKNFNDQVESKVIAPAFK